MKIALVQCPMFNVRMPQLGPAYLKSNLEIGGHNVIQFDFNISLYNSLEEENRAYWNYEFEMKWTKNSIDSERLEDIETQINEDIQFLSEPTLEGWAEDVIKSQAEIIGFTIYYSSAKVSILLAKKIKQLDKRRKIIFGGPAILSFLDVPRDNTVGLTMPINNILKMVDVVVAGEGEEVILDVVERLKENKTFKGCLGVIVNENDSLVVNRLRLPNEKLDLLVFPDFSILNSHRFTDKGFLPIIASRGCPNRCTFCDFPYLDRYKLRFRSAKNVIEEIKWQIGKHKIQFFHFNDSVINTNLGFLNEICELIIREGISIRWGASAIINAEMNKVLFDKMKQSGCEYLSFGIESASEKVLRDMRKFFRIETARRNMIDCHDAGISVCTNWIIGYFTETEDDFEQTLRFIEENINYINEIDVALFSIKPHTYVYNNYKKLGILFDKKSNWYVLNKKNNYKVRSRRLRKFRQFQEKLGTNMNNRIGGVRD